MPIRAGGALADARRNDDESEANEQDALLSHDEENGRLNNHASKAASKLAGSSKANGNGQGSSKYRYGAVWHRAAQTAKRNKHRVEISEKLRDFPSDKFNNQHRSREEIKVITNKKVREFYAEQNRRLEDWFEVDAVVRALAEDVLRSFEPQDRDDDGIAEDGGELQVRSEHIDEMLPEDERERRQKNARQARIAINVNVAANVLLVIAKAVATIFSSSLSLLASLTDSVLDLLMTLIIFTTAKLVVWKSPALAAKYPVGRRRMQPLGTLVFSVIMVVSFLQILQESVQTLTGKDHEVAKLPPAAIGSMVATIVLKGAIWFGCAWQQSSQVQALAQDCKTDVIFNVASLAFPAIGVAANVWWLDPLGAGLLSIYIVFDWARTCLEHANRLSGASVDPRTQKKLMLMAWRFSPAVNAYKNIKAYHAGDGVWVECDLLLDPSTDLRHAHDLAELMQYCFEALSEVDRAFVTVDYAVDGPVGHAALL